MESNLLSSQKEYAKDQAILWLDKYGQYFEVMSDKSTSKSKEKRLENQELFNLDSSLEWAKHIEIKRMTCAIDPQFLNSSEIMLHCTTNSLAKNKKRILDYYLACYEKMDFNTALMFYYYCKTGNFVGVNFCDKITKEIRKPLHVGVTINATYGVTVEELIDYIRENLNDYKELEAYRDKTWKSYRENIYEAVARYLFFCGYNDINETTTALQDIFYSVQGYTKLADEKESKEVSNMRTNYARLMKKDWFYNASLLLREFREEKALLGKVPKNVELYCQDKRAFDLGFDEESHQFFLS